MFQRIWKPWFVYRPWQLVRRAAGMLAPRPQPGYQSLATSWGVPVRADPTRVIGQSIIHTGLFDLAVSETLARLISPGNTVIDAGANVGYMTVLAAVATGARGRVLAFEPHPELFQQIEQNITAARAQFELAKTELHNAALGEATGTADLHLGDDFATNDGVARIEAEPHPAGASLRVPMKTLDEVLGTDDVQVMKLDVEGYEPQVLQGAAQALAARRIHHIVFEDLNLAESATVPRFQQLGYRVFALGWAMNGLLVQPVEQGRLATHYEAPNFIATIDPDDLLARCKPRGWRVLKKGLAKRCR